MQWLRWLFFLIFAWSIASAWAEDKFAAPGSSRFAFYLIALGAVSAFAIAFEVRDILRASRTKTRR